MSLSRLLAPLQVTTSPAPDPGEGHVDVRVDDAPPACVVDADPFPAGAVAPVAAPAGTIHFDPTVQIGRTPPGYTPGVCCHPGHVLLDGLRYGVTPTSSDSIPNTARLMLCHHSNPAGA